MSNAAASIGIALPTIVPAGQPFDIAGVTVAAEWAEAVGFDAVWASDHLYYPQQMLEALTVLGFAAARTSSIKLGTAIYQLPLRPTASAAKQIATLASLSGGRLVLGVGVGGDWPDEWAAADASLKERGMRMEEGLPLLKRLLRGEKVDFNGRFHTLRNIAITPPPPPVPVLVAGRAAPALRRAALLGDGWFGFFLTPKGFRREVAQIRALRDEAGLADQPYQLAMQFCVRIDSSNDGAGLRAAEVMNAGFPPGTALTPSDKLQHLMLAGTADAVAERLREYIEAGCGTVCLSVLDSGERAHEQFARLAADVLPRLRG